MNRFSSKWFLASYPLLLCCVAPLRPLWLDECLQLSDTYRHTLPETIERVAHNPGGVPLAYLGENIFVNATPHPIYAAHLFSILCALGGMASLICLLRLLHSPNPAFAAFTYALLPISLRYAVEARQYGPALAFSVAATAALVWLDQQPTVARTALYAFFLTLGIYCQPYVAFMAVAHALWALRRGGSAKYILAACFTAALLFLPWYLYARGFWADAVIQGGYKSSIGWKTPLMILRELSGGGYLLSAALLCLAAFGYRRTTIPTAGKQLLLLCTIVPLPLVILGNLQFHYFFAIRQLLFIVPPLCVLAAEGLPSFPIRPALVATLLALVAVGYDIHWFTSGGPSPCSDLAGRRSSSATFVP